MVQILEHQCKQEITSTYYSPLPFFMLRTPLLSLESYENLVDLKSESYENKRKEAIEQLQKFVEDLAVRESLAHSSQSLLQSLAFLSDDKSPRKQMQAIRGFQRYLIRMMTRPTPFGLNAGIAQGSFSDEVQLSIPCPSEFQKHSRPDMEWLFGLVKKFESYLELVEQLHVRKNTSCYLVGSKLKIPFQTAYLRERKQQKNSATSVSIDYSSEVSFVLDCANSPVEFIELFNRLCERNPDVEKGIIRQFLFELVQQEFLLTELRPPLTNYSPFQYIANKLEMIKGFEAEKKAIRTILSKINDYNLLAIGEGYELYIEITKNMKDLFKSDDVLLTDMSLNAKDITLPKEVGEEASKAADVLLYLNYSGGRSPHISKYHQEFIERYGLHKEVSLLQLLDEDFGIGVPAGYEYPRSRKNNEFVPSYSNRLMTYIHNRVTEAIHDQSLEIELKDEVINKIVATYKDNIVPIKSGELLFLLTANSEEGIQAGNYSLILSPNHGSSGVGRMFGRFLHILEPNVHEELQKSFQKEQAQYGDTVMAELVCPPIVARHANVMLTKNLREYEIAINTNSSQEETKTLHLDDLLVGVTEDSFYIKSKKLNKRVIPVVNHMYNPAFLTPNVYRFLREIAREGQTGFNSIQWGEFEKSTILPRVRYGKVILSSAQWRLNKFAIDIDEHTNLEDGFLRFQEWCRKWSVPRYVYLTLADNRILLDLSHPLHVEEILREFTKLSNLECLLFVEAESIFLGGAVGNELGRYVAEVVIPLEKKVAQISKFEIPNEQSFGSDNQIFVPGNEWIYGKLYYQEEREEEIIGLHLSNFAEEVIQGKTAELFFFIRYRDPNPHIRFRFFGETDHLNKILFPLLASWTQKLVSDGIVTRVVYDTYQPEVERYGGPELIHLAERVFSTDSALIGRLLYLNTIGELNLDIQTLAVFNIIDILKSFGFTAMQSFDWLDKRVNYKQYLKDYREKKELYTKVANAIFTNEQYFPSEFEQFITQYNARKEAILEYATKIKSVNKYGKLYNSMDGIISSVIHMHLNRLIGTNRVEEDRVKVLSRHTLQNLKNR